MRCFSARLSALFLLIPLTSAAQPGQSAGGIESATLSSPPLVRQGTDGLERLLRLEISGGPLEDAECVLRSSAFGEPVEWALDKPEAGTITVERWVSAPAGGFEIAASLSAGDGTAFEIRSEIEPPREWTVYLVQHTHTDIGYTRPQTEILPEHLRYIDYALDYCDLTDGYPDAARFRWTCETAWAVKEYLKRRPASQIDRLRKRVLEGRIEVGGMLLNMSEIATERSLAASLQPIREFRRMGFPVRTALQNDVNGAAWCLVDYFAGMGIRYLSMGINETRSIRPFDKPTLFWWESPSGNRILAYRPDHYMTANFWQLHTAGEEAFRKGLADYLVMLDDRGYPFGQISVQFSGYFTDNSPPSTHACDLVADWNEDYATPKLRLATMNEFLSAVEETGKDELPVFRAAWPDWWTDGFGSAARETAASRQTHAEMRVTEALLAMAPLFGAEWRPGLAERVWEVQEDLLFYDEHTFGAAESISDPGAGNSMVQWGEKASYVWEAIKKSNLLREEAWGLLQEHLPRADRPAVTVMNTLNWTRPGLAMVFIDHEILPEDRAFRIVDRETGEAIPAQAMSRRAEGGFWGLWVEDVPPMGYKTLVIETLDEPREPERKADSADVLENRYYKIGIDGETASIVSLIDKETGKEWVDADAEWNLGQCVYETLSGGRDMLPERFKRVSVRNAEIEPGADGPVWKSVVLSADLEGCADKNGFRAEIRLFGTEKRIELHYAVRKLPVTEPEALYVAFPFKMDDFEMVYEGQGGLVVPGETQIPGSSSDWHTVQNVIAVRGGGGQAALSSCGAPLVQLGGFNLGKWQRVAKVDAPVVYSWVMNNYWFTNFRAFQEGEFRWSYSLTTMDDPGEPAAVRFGWNSRIPLAARVFPPSAGKAEDYPASRSMIELDHPSVLLAGAVPSRGGDGIVLHLRETGGAAADVDYQFLSAGPAIRRVDVVNVLEEPLEENVRTIRLRPYESRFVKLVLKPE